MSGFAEAIAGIFSAGASKLVDSIGEALDRNITSDHERLQLEAQVQEALKDLQEKVLIAKQVEEQELTKRAQADMQSDSPLAKNVRPLTLIFLTLAVTGIAVWTIDGVAPERVGVLSVWTDLFTGLLMLVYGFYFGSRGLEKIAEKIGNRLSTNLKR